MLLKDLLLEFEFNCQVRKLSPRNRRQLQKANSVFAEFSGTGIQRYRSGRSRTHHDKTFSCHYDQFRQEAQLCKRPLKAFKCYFKYAVEEEYTDTLLTAKIKNVKEPKVIIHTFTNGEISKMIQYYNKNDFLSVRNKAILCTFFLIQAYGLVN